MCVLIAAPAGKVVPDEYLSYCNENNPHGIGMAWRETQQLRTWKTDDPKNIGHAIQQAKKIVDYDRLIHFRWATSGVKDKTNVHPFFVDDARTLAMAHNGVLSITNVDKKSDTRTFADHFLKWLAPGWWHDPVCMEQVVRLIHSDRVALLHLTDGIILLNPKQYEEEDGVYYSNRNYKPSPYATSRRGVGFSSHSCHGDEYGDYSDGYASGAMRRGHNSGSSRVATPASVVDYPEYRESEDGLKAGRSFTEWCAKRDKERHDLKAQIEARELAAKETAGEGETVAAARESASTRESAATDDGASKNDRAVIRNARELKAVLTAHAATTVVGASEEEMDLLDAGVEILAELNIDPTIGYFIWPTSVMKSMTYCAKCVDPRIAAAEDRAQPITASDCNYMFAERCIGCGVDLLELAAVTVAAMLDDLVEPDEPAESAVYAESAADAPRGKRTKRGGKRGKKADGYTPSFVPEDATGTTGTTPSTGLVTVPSTTGKVVTPAEAAASGTPQEKEAVQRLLPGIVSSIASALGDLVH